MATMKDVAALAGVDKGTVSRVLNGDPRISAATAERVWEAVRALNYRPDKVASGLSRGTSGLVALVLANASAWWVGPLLEGMARSLGLKGRGILVLGQGWFRSIPEELASRRVDGAVWMGPVEGEVEVSFPLVCWGLDVGPHSVGFSLDRLQGSILEAVGPFRYVGYGWSPFSQLEGAADPSASAAVVDLASGPFPPGQVLGGDVVLCGPPPGVRGRLWVPFSPMEVGTALGRTLLLASRASARPLRVRLEARLEAQG
ncbi:transcriptional regulator, LacI family [Thermanaerovibrio acidaminovorans DSM 6589]|uniref:Transcriptional regulator, LacI family n=2 Tax=Thermanaerovibrio TaxID=81461 RepID=D1B8Z8_THEAS|nr:transcriptional regulator, LacI family [Thermanaerovibrio acidaminovorans DSM 6589]